MLLKIPVAIICLMLCTGIYAQAQSTVTGTVKDDSGEALIGATVTVPGTTIGTTTGAGGTYELRNVPSGASLLFSFIGYEPQEVQVGARTEINVVLVSDSRTIDDVVVIGYGTVRKSDLTGSVSKISSEAIGDRPLARAEQALQGTLPGVQVRNTTGEPGADIQIRVRGAASVNASSDPLYVIDGVPSSTLQGLNPSDIESMEVLKDAASAAIYGSRGSNGVVLVTTKRGKTGKAQVSFNMTFGVQQVSKYMDVLSGEEWIDNYIRANDIRYLQQAANLGVTNASIKDDNATRISNLNLTGRDVSYNLDDRWQYYVSDDVRNAHTWAQTDEKLNMLDWQKEFFRIAPVHDYNVTVAGGTDDVRYLFSVGYFDQKGIATGTSYRRISARANIDANITRWMTVGVKLAPTYSVSDGAGRANGKDSQMHQVIASSPVSEEGVGYRTASDGNERYPWAGSAASPIVMMEGYTRTDYTIRMNAQGYMRINPVEGLNIEGLLATNFYDNDGTTYNPTWSTNNWANGDGANSSGSHVTERRFDNTLMQVVANYSNKFGRHNLNVMAGASNEENHWGWQTEQSYSAPFPDDEVTGSFDGSIVTPNSNIVTQLQPDRLISYFGRIMYDFDSRYLLSVSLRYDGGSVFGANNRWGVFPAFSGAWRLSEEKFWKNLNVDHIVSQIKLRASYGVTGNKEIGRDAAYSLLEKSVYAGYAGYRPASLGNSDLGWEKTKSTDVGMDLTFLKNRIHLSLDWYTKKTTDLLYEVPIPLASGFGTYWDNLGDVKNRGFEVEFESVNFNNSQFKWTTSFNYSFNKNKVLSLGIDNTPIQAGITGVGGYTNILQVGKAINSFHMFEAIGVWKNQKEIDDWATSHGLQPSQVTFNGTTIKPGDIRYRDVDGDGIYTDEGDRHFLGSPIPRNTFGMTNTFQYKGFDLSFLITAQTGGKIYGALGRAVDRPSMGTSTNALGRWRNAWWSEDEPGDGKTPYLLSTTTGTTLDSRWLYSSNYIAIKNLTIGYTIPFKTDVISNARVFFMIENLANFNNYYGGYNPEAANSGVSGAPGGSNALGLDYFGYPLARIYSFGVNISF
ncbi:MAG: TonB-dependent receptor [Alistipes sp.]|nr:TonB-dependent receptor [Alistipes sp.]